MVFSFFFLVKSVAKNLMSFKLSSIWSPPILVECKEGKRGGTEVHNELGTMSLRLELQRSVVVVVAAAPALSNS